MSSDPTLGLVLGLGGGLFSFFRGFRIYREYRVIGDTPQIPVRSIPMGLVNIHGKAAGEQSITSPVSHSSCFFYKVDIQKWKEEQRSSGWSHYRTDMDGVKFYLEDGSGKVLVDVRCAELDLTKICEHEVSSAGNTTFQTGVIQHLKNERLRTTGNS